MLQSRVVTLLFTGMVLVMISLVIAAPPKTAGSKKKTADGDATATDDADAKKKVVKTDAEWKKILTPIQFKVARKKGTEQAFGRDYAKFKKEGNGTYQCVCCGQTLFES